ncbi:MAG: hypothetical protein AAF228_14050 [Pseudomonadota bacterium]
MDERMKRVITVSKDREIDLQAFGDAASLMFQHQAAYVNVIERLKEEGIPYLDRYLDIGKLSDHQGHWYYKELPEPT